MRRSSSMHSPPRWKEGDVVRFKCANSLNPPGSDRCEEWHFASITDTTPPPPTGPGPTGRWAYEVSTVRGPSIIYPRTDWPGLDGVNVAYKASDDEWNEFALEKVAYTEDAED